MSKNKDDRLINASDIVGEFTAPYLEYLTLGMFWYWRL